MTEPRRSQLILSVILILGFLLGIGIRLVDLEDPPLGFNPTRQLRSAIIARGLYYERTPGLDPEKRELAISHKRGMEHLEPPVLESLTAWVYQMMGGENLWVTRILTSVFWMVGAAAVYDLGKRMASPLAATVGVGYYLFLPFSIRASRSFQPDPLMVMMILLTAWALFRWSEERSWKWAIIAGLLGGLASFVKLAGLFICGGMVLGIIVYHYYFTEPLVDGKRLTIPRKTIALLRSGQIWVMGGLIISFALGYYFLGIGKQSSDYLATWTIISRWREVLDPSFYVRWMISVDGILNLGIVTAGIIGILLTKPKNQALLWGFLGGYILLGLFFPHHIITHDYYHLPLVGFVALALIPLFHIIIIKINESGKYVRVIFTGVVLVYFAYNGWMGYSLLKGQDFREHPAFWKEVSESIPVDARAVGLTQDYGFRLMYYGWRKISLWPVGGESGSFDKEVGDADYFIITSKNQLNIDLANYLEINFPIHAKGIGYQIYDIGIQK
jgi:hypothetical protein